MLLFFISSSLSNIEGVIYVMFYSQLEWLDIYKFHINTTSLYIFRHTGRMTHSQEIKKHDK